MVNPNSLPTSAYFEYGLTIPYESSSFLQIVGSGTNGVAFSQAISGLAAGNTYHFRLVSTSRSGVSYGDDQTFATDLLPLAFQAVTQTNGLITFVWTSRIGNRYQLQYTTNLLSAVWIDLGAPVTATGVSLSASDLIGADSQRFYRVTLPP